MNRLAFIGAVCTAALLLFTPVRSAFAQLIFTAPPRESLQQGEALYTPIANHLTELLGEQVTYRHPGNWLNYAREMRNAGYDIVFDGPQFVSWRMANLDHQVLIKLPGSLVFHIVARADDGEIQSAVDLVGQKVCGIAPPNLGTLTVIKQYPNPARQPIVRPVKGGFKGVFKTLMDGGCRAAVLRTQFYDKKLSDDQKSRLKIVLTSEPVPNQAISVSGRLTDSGKKKIVASLTGPENPALAGLLNRFARQSRAFLPADPADFQGHNRLLEGVIFGW